MLLILLLGKNLENFQLPSGEQISSSHFFFPLSSKMGLDEKSSSQLSDVGGWLEDVLELVDADSTVSASEMRGTSKQYCASLAASKILI